MESGVKFAVLAGALVTCGCGDSSTASFVARSTGNHAQDGGDGGNGGRTSGAGGAAHGSSGAGGSVGGRGSGAGARDGGTSSGGTSSGGTGAGGILSTGGVFATGGASSGGAGDGGMLSTGGASSGGAGGGSGGGASTGGTAGGCSGVTRTAESVPIDMYVLFNQSGSMSDAVTGGSKWDVMKGALTTFVQNTGLAGNGFGIGYFPFTVPNPPSPCMTDTDCGSYGPCQTDPAHMYVCTKSDSCLSANYLPDVPIALFPGVSGAIVNSLNAHSPGGFTPTYPALQGTYQYVSTWAAAHSDHRTILVLATDGDPTTCDANTNNVNAIAQNLVAPALSAKPSILTFVVGIGSSLTSLNQIAAAGGTQQARIVDTTGANPGDQFLSVLKAIQTSEYGDCQYKLPVPASGSLDPAKVNVQLTPAGGSPSLIKQVGGLSACTAGGGGWYYDDAVTPTQIVLCSSTCSAAQTVSAKVEIALGCATVQ